MGKKLTKQLNDDLDAFLTFLKTKYTRQIEHAINKRKGVCSTPLPEPTRHVETDECMPSTSDGSAKNSSG